MYIKLHPDYADSPSGQVTPEMWDEMQDPFAIQPRRPGRIEPRAMTIAKTATARARSSAARPARLTRASASFPG